MIWHKMINGTTSINLSDRAARDEQYRTPFDGVHRSACGWAPTPSVDDELGLDLGRPLGDVDHVGIRLVCCRSSATAGGLVRSRRSSMGCPPIAAPRQESPGLAGEEADYRLDLALPDHMPGVWYHGELAIAEVPECSRSLIHRAEVVAIVDQDQGRHGDLDEIAVAVAGPVRPALEGAPDVRSPVALAAR